MAKQTKNSSAAADKDNGPLLMGVGFLVLGVLALLVGLWYFRWFSDLYEVRGRVLRAGQPIEMADCRITFINSEQGLFAPAKLAPDGSYRVFSYKESGLRTGKYQVVVSFPPEYLPPTDPRDPLKPLPPDELEKRLAKFIPRKYRDPKTSGLTLEVKDDDVQFDVNMTD